MKTNYMNEVKKTIVNYAPKFTPRTGAVTQKVGALPKVAPVAAKLVNVALSKPASVAITKPVTVAASRDLEIVRMILEMRYMSLRQITKKFFGEPSLELISEAIKSVHRIRDLGLIKTKDAELGNESLFVVTAKGQEMVALDQPDKLTPMITKSIFAPRVKHDLLLNDLRIRFEELGFLNKWVSETSMKESPFFNRSFTNLPDAVCKKKNDKGYFLELEVSMKSPKVYTDRINEYLAVLATADIKDAGIEGVVFFCTDEKVRDKIKLCIPAGVKSVSVLLYASYFKNNGGNHES